MDARSATLMDTPERHGAKGVTAWGWGPTPERAGVGPREPKKMLVRNRSKKNVGQTNEVQHDICFPHIRRCSARRASGCSRPAWLWLVDSGGAETARRGALEKRRRGSLLTRDARRLRRPSLPHAVSRR